MFSQAVCEKIGYYVYYLVDPRTDIIFYVGKGKGNRVFQHVKGISEENTFSEKINIIKEIISYGLEVKYIVLRHGLTEKEAFEVESAVIDFVGLEQLTNEVYGHDAADRGKMTTDEINAIYDAEEVIITDPVLIININRLFKRTMGKEELYYSTRSAWKLSKRRENAKYALSVYRGIVREVYLIEKWNRKQIEDGKTRWEFEGPVANDEIRNKYIAKSINKYIKRGAQNPIKYVNC
ncbi:MAG: hypothetical protein GX434_18260 [Peptococcaceae bacterium]|nr:hypothetical protein [Peptococcaceae bacterium]